MPKKLLVNLIDNKTQKVGPQVLLVKSDWTLFIESARNYFAWFGLFVLIIFLCWVCMMSGALR